MTPTFPYGHDDTTPTAQQSIQKDEGPGQEPTNTQTTIKIHMTSQNPQQIFKGAFLLLRLGPL